MGERQTKMSKLKGEKKRKAGVVELKAKTDAKAKSTKLKLCKSTAVEATNKEKKAKYDQKEIQKEIKRERVEKEKDSKVVNMTKAQESALKKKTKEQRAK